MDAHTNTRPIGIVLMPGNRVHAVRWFNEYAGVNQNQIWTKHQLHRVQKIWVPTNIEPALILGMWFTEIVGTVQQARLSYLG